VRNKKAKWVKRTVYGATSIKNPREYIRLSNGQIVNKPNSLRAIYQKLKRAI